MSEARWSASGGTLLHLGPKGWCAKFIQHYFFGEGEHRRCSNSPQNFSNLLKKRKICSGFDSGRRKGGGGGEDLSLSSLPGTHHLHMGSKLQWESHGSPKKRGMARSAPPQLILKSTVKKGAPVYITIKPKFGAGEDHDYIGKCRMCWGGAWGFPCPAVFLRDGPKNTFSQGTKKMRRKNTFLSGCSGVPGESICHLGIGLRA